MPKIQLSELPELSFYSKGEIRIGCSAFFYATPRAVTSPTHTVPYRPPMTRSGNSSGILGSIGIHFALDKLDESLTSDNNGKKDQHRKRGYSRETAAFRMYPERSFKKSAEHLSVRTVTVVYFNLLSVSMKGEL
ncbi:hypothetical protein ACFL7E_01245 [Thermodesulfobacteriota bacterium]